MVVIVGVEVGRVLVNFLGFLVELYYWIFYRVDLSFRVVYDIRSFFFIDDLSFVFLIF